MSIDLVDAAVNEVTLRRLQEQFGNRVLVNVPLARYTAARIGGPAEIMLIAESAKDLAQICSRVWQMDIPLVVLGGGSNVLVSDSGVRGVVLLNRARQVDFQEQDQLPILWAESGVNFGALARQAAIRGLAGLEWAAGIPGTVGGAVVGNAGAYGADMTSNLKVAKILQRDDVRMSGVGDSGIEPDIGNFVQSWSLEKLEYTYRSSLLKRNPGRYIVLSACLHLEKSQQDIVQAKIDTLTAQRHRSQPPGASMGSMFKNPPGDYAGRLIDAAGMKGSRVGGAEISALHANFFVNRGDATAMDVYALIVKARQEVYLRFGIMLELEVELIGDWPKRITSEKLIFEGDL